MFKISLVISIILISVSVYGSELQSASPTPSPTPVSHADEPIECFQSSIEWGLTFHQSILLCTHAMSQDPIQCFQYVFRTLIPGFTNDQKVNLCQGATSEAPVKCFEESFDLLLTLDQRIKLCNGAIFRTNNVPNQVTVSTAPAHCYIRSIKFFQPLTPDERIILCANADSDDPALCFKRADLLTLTFDQRVRLCTQLSPSSW